MAGAHLTYYDGPVLSNVKSVDVSYGPGTFISTGHLGAAAIGNFTGQYLGSGVMDWLSEYDTNVSGGTHQLIGRGTYGGNVTITPSPARNGTSITDAQIQSELAAQITAGVLPTPDANTSYALFFRLGQSICTGGSCSLVSGGFCAYHGTFSYNGVTATYQVMPDLTGIAGCGASTDLNNTTSVLSHELAETITDPQVGFATVFGPPLGWYDSVNGEIGDICNAQQGTFVGTDAVTYTLQTQFSNVSNNCIVTRSVANDFSIGAAPTTLSLAAGGSGSSTISTAVASGAAASVSLSVTGAPAGATAVPTPASVTAGTSSALTVAAGTALPGSYVLTVTGTEGASTHSATVGLTITPLTLAITTTSLAPGVVGSPYSQALGAQGGNSPYSWKLVAHSGVLPKGLTLNKSTGVISGMPKKATGATFTIEVLDTKAATKPHARNTATAVLTITVT